MYSMARSVNVAWSAMRQPYTARDGTRSATSGDHVRGRDRDRRRHRCRQPTSTVTQALAPRPITWASPTRAPATWRGPASPRSWRTSSTTWPRADAPERLALGEQTARSG